MKDQFSSTRDIHNSINSQIDVCSWVPAEFTLCGQWEATKNTEPFVWTQETSLGDQRLSQERRVSLTSSTMPATMNWSEPRLLSNPVLCRLMPPHSDSGMRLTMPSLWEERLE